MIDSQRPSWVVGAVARAALVALLVLLVAVMPVTSSVVGVHETWLSGGSGGFGSMPRVRVTVRDHTGGLIRAVSPVGIEADSSPRMIVVSWMGGCGDRQTDIAFYRDAQAYIVTEATDAAGCNLLVGYGRAVALHLWSPIDPASLELIGRHDER